jgi:dTDP-L-rhamnose 4-epimerase
MRVLITGGAGFIGTHTADVLADRGHEVLLLDALIPEVHPRYPEGRPPYVIGDLAIGDVRDIELLDRLLPGVDAVCHLAALAGLGVDAADMPSYVEYNDLGTAVLLAAMTRAGVRRLAVASSIAVYGEGRSRCPEHGIQTPGPRRPETLGAGRFEPRCPRCGAEMQPEPITEDAPTAPMSTYAATKLAQENLAMAWARITGGSTHVLRYHHVYGPLMPRDTPYSGVAAVFRAELAAGRAPRLYEDGRQLRDFVHVRDVAAANMLALERTGRGGVAVHNVASGEPHTVGDLAQGLSKAMNGPEPVITRRLCADRPRHIIASPARAREELGFTAAEPFAQGVREFATAPLRESATTERALQRA